MEVAKVIAVIVIINLLVKDLVCCYLDEAPLQQSSHRPKFEFAFLFGLDLLAATDATKADLTSIY